MKKSENPHLTVTDQLTANPLLHFAYLSDDSKENNSAVILPFEVLAQSENYQEIWQDNALTHETQKSEAGVRIIKSEQFLALVFNSDSNALGDVVDKVYDQAFSHSKALGYLHLIRVWNFFPAINDDEAGMENYQRFCIARHSQIDRHQQLNQPNPAATAIGTHNQLSAYVFIFAKQPGLVIENKRQVSAWEYPLHYSPKQPRFSRAMQIDDLLMCSGTASVVGHQTKHKDDLSRQFLECLANINVLLESAQHKAALHEGLFRFYLRHHERLSELQQCIAAAGLKKYVILAGDICRQDLLVECEAVFQ